MTSFRDLRLRRKLTLAMMLTAVVTLSVGCLAWFGYDWAESKKSLVKELRSMAFSTAHDASPGVVFADAESLSESMYAFGDHPNVFRVAVLSKAANFPTVFRNAGAGEPDLSEPEKREEGAYFFDSYLSVYVPILGQGASGAEVIGMVVVESDYSLLHQRQARFAGIVVMVALLSLLIAFGMAYKLQSMISSPIIELTATVRAVAESKDYSMRGSKWGNDEVGFLTDSFNSMLTEIQSRDMELEASKDTLELEVLQRTKELVSSNAELKVSIEEAQAAAVAKAEFLANMSHEIRTPMNGVLGMNSLLLESPLSAVQRGYAEIVNGSAQDLLSIINDILDFSKIEAGKLSLEEIEFEFRRIVSDVSQLLSPAVRDKGLSFHCDVAADVPTILRGDPTRLRQVITNLIGNAVKFTSEGSVSIRVECRSSSREEVCLWIAITDTGIGIPDAARDRLFRSFSQVDNSTTRKYGGTGLGLVICKQLAELMGGEIGLDSELGKGSTFWFTVRMARPSAEGLHNCLVPEGGASPRILVADQVASSAKLLSEQLMGWSLDFDLVQDRESFERSLASARGSGRPYSLILVDRSMAEESLLEALLFAQKHDRAKVLSMEWMPLDWAGKNDNAQRAEAMRYTPDFTLCKPIESSALFDALLALTRSMTDDSKKEKIKHLDEREHNNAVQPLRILLAEDNRINQLVASKILSKGGFACTIVGNGQLALDALAQESFDLVLMDCQMPVLDGFRASETQREREAGTGQHVHIIALTANAMKGDRDLCIAAGMDDYLSKPVDPKVLLEKLNSLQDQINAAGKAQQPAQAAILGPPFEADDLLERFSGRAEELRRELTEISAHALDSLGRINYCLSVKDAEETSEAVQELCNSISMLSCERFHQLAMEVEQLGSAGNYQDALQRFELLQHEFDRWRAYLPDFLARVEA